jgi:NADP-dependent alcohol dehydrogenase
MPRFAVLDPVLTYTLPARQVANGVVDAFIHTLEQYLTYPVDAKVQDRFAEGLLLTLAEEGPRRWWSRKTTTCVPTSCGAPPWR